VRELVQVPGDGFGAGDHPTSALCLEALAGLPAGPALDAGCGSGVLSLAWAALGRGPVLAVDLDHAAALQARRAVAAAGCGHLVIVRHGPLERLTAGEIAGRVVLANMPLAAHRALLDRVGDPPPRAVLLSGLRPGQAGEIVAAWRRLGLRVSGAARRRRWERWTLVAG
jgi:ribosomal protein L11 methyltransferase